MARKGHAGEGWRGPSLSAYCAHVGVAMKSSTGRFGPILAFAVTGAAALGFAGGQLVGDRAQHTVTGVAMLADDGNGLTVLNPGNGHPKIPFDARSVDWYDSRGTFHDGIDGSVPPCLHVRRPTRVQASYVDIDQQSLVAWLKCLR